MFAGTIPAVAGGRRLPYAASSSDLDVFMSKTSTATHTPTVDTSSNYPHVDNLTLANVDGFLIIHFQ